MPPDEGGACRPPFAGNRLVPHIDPVVAQPLAELRLAEADLQGGACDPGIPANSRGPGNHWGPTGNEHRFMSSVKRWGERLRFLSEDSDLCSEPEIAKSGSELGFGPRRLRLGSRPGPQIRLPNWRSRQNHVWRIRIRTWGELTNRTWSTESPTGQSVRMRVLGFQI